MAVLRGEPTTPAALLGLERVLPPLGRLPELLPLVRRALAADSTNRVFRALEVRTLATLNDPDSAADAARRWIALAPGEEGPYREWALALADARRFDEARAVLVAGQRARPARRRGFRGGARGARAPGGGLDGTRGRAGAGHERARRGADPPGRPRRGHRAARRGGRPRPGRRPRGPGPGPRASPPPPGGAGARGPR